jgi:CHAD domain-containing protein
VAKAREIPGLSADDSYAAAAAKIVDVRAQELADHAAGVLDVGDIERVHDMRVATRRLRAALEVFGPCFPAKRLKADLGEVKQLADGLGERRDRDVAIAALEGLVAKMPAPDHAGIESLVDRLRDEQRRANEELARFVDPEGLASLHERLGELVAAARAAAPDAGSRRNGGAEAQPAGARVEAEGSGTDGSGG